MVKDEDWSKISHFLVEANLVISSFLIWFCFMKYYFQVELLLGKAYSDWGHVSDAVSIYDQLISNHPDDFRGYLAKVHVIIWCTYHINDSLSLQP